VSSNFRRTDCLITRQDNYWDGDNATNNEYIFIRYVSQYLARSNCWSYWQWTTVECRHQQWCGKEEAPSNFSRTDCSVKGETSVTATVQKWMHSEMLPKDKSNSLCRHTWTILGLTIWILLDVVVPSDCVSRSSSFPKNIYFRSYSLLPNHGSIQAVCTDDGGGGGREACGLGLPPGRPRSLPPLTGSMSARPCSNPIQNLWSLIKKKVCNRNFTSTRAEGTNHVCDTKAWTNSFCQNWCFQWRIIYAQLGKRKDVLPSTRQSYIRWTWRTDWETFCTILFFLI